MDGAQLGDQLFIVDLLVTGRTGPGGAVAPGGEKARIAARKIRQMSSTSN